MNWARLIDEKVALVTGSASGIGRATARLIAQHGACVVLVDINEEGGTLVAEEINARGEDALLVRADVSSGEQVSAMLQSALYGRLEVVDNNAASYRLGKASERSEAAWDDTQSTRPKASWMIARNTTRAMLRNGPGAFTIAASVQAILGYTRHCVIRRPKAGFFR